MGAVQFFLICDGNGILGKEFYPDDGLTSTIYYLPREGDDEPKVVTKPWVGASYFHSWSPDNRKMVFTGNRNGNYDIHTVDIETGVETPLTDLPTLDDGPEYSPDRKYAFFYSTRTGKMKVWRMDANGDHQTQLTFDDYNDWFPHVSPDQKWIALIHSWKKLTPVTIRLTSIVYCGSCHKGEGSIKLFRAR